MSRIWPPQTPLLRFILGGPIPDAWDPEKRPPPAINDLDSPAADLFAPRRRRKFARPTNRKLWGEPQRSAIDAVDFMEARILPGPEVDDA